MKIPGSFKTFFHSMIGVVVALVIFYFSLNFLRTHGPVAVQGPATALGSAVSGKSFNF